MAHSEDQHHDLYQVSGFVARWKVNAVRLGVLRAQTRELLASTETPPYETPACIRASMIEATLVETASQRAVHTS